MKKVISVLVSLSLLVSLVSLSSGSFAAGSLKNSFRLKYIVYDEGGYSYTVYNQDGTKAGEPAKPQIQPAKKSAMRTAGSLPASYSSADAGVLPNVKNQGETGTCWAFASVTALEADAVSQGLMQRNEMKFSPSHLTWFSYTLPSDGSGNYGEGYYSSTPYMMGGNFMVAASTLLEWSGIAKLSDYPFIPFSTELMSNIPEQYRYDTGSGFIIDSVREFTQADDIKQWVMNHGVCTCGIYYNKDFENTVAGAYYCPNETKMNHNISIVGWDDSYSASNFITRPPADGAWLIMDSWGTSAHSNGFYWLSYCNATFDYAAGFTVREKGNEYRNYNYNGAPYNGFISVGLPDLTIANVFTAGGYEKLSSVSFFNSCAGITATVKIYKNLTDAADPSSGALSGTYTVQADYEGLYTVHLDSKVPVTPGSKFSVVIEMTDPSGEAVEAPIEAPEYADEYQIYTAGAGESFADIGIWADVTEYNYGNFCISAFSECSHPYQHITVQPTCTEDGSVSDICPQCGEVYSSVVLPAAGHSFSEWSEYIDKGTYCESTRTCSVCGEVQTKTLNLSTKKITIDALLRIIFDRIIAALRAAFR